MKNRRRASAVWQTHHFVPKLAFGYMALAGLWIMLSDQAVAWMIADSNLRLFANTVKGLLFVVVTGGLLYIFLTAWAESIGAESSAVKASDVAAIPGKSALVFVILALIVPLMVAAFLKTHVLHLEKRTYDDLAAIAKLKADQIESWLEERNEDQQVLAASTEFQSAVHQFVQGNRDPKLRHRIETRFKILRKRDTYHSILLTDDAGNLIYSQGPDLDNTPDTRLLVARAIASRQIQRSELYRDESANIHMDWIVPVVISETHGERAVAAIILRIVAAKFLFPLIQSWPTESASAETLLVRREGDAVIYLNELRHQRDTALRLRFPIDNAELLGAAAVLAGQPGRQQGRDYRGVTVLAVAWPVAGTDWKIVAKVDRDEMVEPMWLPLYWIFSFGLAAIGVVLLMLLMLWRQQQHIQRQVLQTQKEDADSLISTLVDNSTDAIFAKDADGRYLLVNRETTRLLGKTREQIVGQDDRALLPPEQAAIIRENDRGVMAEGRVGTYEEAVSTVDGERIFLATKGVLHDRNGLVIGIFGISRDITTRMKMDRELAESEARYRQLFNGSRDALILVRPSTGRAVEANQAARDLFAVPRDMDITTLTAADVSLERQADGTPSSDVTQRNYVTALREGSLVTEWACCKLNGEPFTADVLMTRVIVGDEALLQFTVRDISERKAIELGIRKLTQAVEQSPESIVITDLDANIEYVNSSFLRNTGYSLEEVIGRNSRLLQSGKTPRETYVALWHELTHGRSWRGELYNRRKDGSEYIEFATISPIRQANGRASNFLAVKEDITERKRNAVELDQYRHHLERLVEQRTQELTAAKAAAEVGNQAKSDFVANMSHEIRTPLNAIVGLTHLLQRGIADPAQKDKLNKIVAASQHLLAVINDILDFSKIEANKLRLNLADFRLDRLLGNVVSLVGEQLRQKHLEIVVEPNVVPPALVGDATRLAQALLNYLSNAIKFTEQGTITLRVSAVEESPADLLARFEVTDTGIGIAPEKIAGLFSAFEQVDATASRRYGGTGLGLTITRRLAHLMGGEAGVQSTLGQGSCFWFTARLAKSHCGLAEQVVVPVALDHTLYALPVGARVLLAEDNPINQEVAVELLAEIGLKVDVAKDGNEALAKARDVDYDLILMDMQMPGMDGLQATRAIRALPTGATLPILAMTANAFEEDREHCLAAGMNDFVAKPVDPKTLYATLLRWLPDKVIAPPVAAQAVGAAAPELAAISGLDSAAGLKALNGHLATYQRLLRRFAIDHAYDTVRLRERMQAGDRNEARRLAHTLKGSAGNMGLVDVRRLAAELEAALRDDRDATDVDRGIDVLEREVRRASSAILAALPKLDDAPDAADVDVTLVRKLLADLAPLLSKGSVQANQVIETHATLFRRALGPLGEKLVQQVDSYLYPEALATLERVREAQGERAAQDGEQA